MHFCACLSYYNLGMPALKSGLSALLLQRKGLSDGGRSLYMYLALRSVS